MTLYDKYLDYLHYRPQRIKCIDVGPMIHHTPLTTLNFLLYTYGISTYPVKISLDLLNRLNLAGVPICCGVSSEPVNVILSFWWTTDYCEIQHKTVSTLMTISAVQHTENCR